MKYLVTSLIGAACALGLTAATASADIVCNGEGDCWHVREHHEYRSELRLRVHPDDWRWADHERDRYRWREHEGHGYWRDGRWVEIR